MPRRGLEPPPLAGQPPQDCVSTNSTTSAYNNDNKIINVPKVRVELTPLAGSRAILWAGEESNLQDFRHTLLKRTRLPVSPPAQKYNGTASTCSATSAHLSGGPDLNRRPSPWQGDILPLNYRRLCAEGQNRTDITCFSDRHRDHLGYLGLVDAEGLEPPTYAM